MRRLAFAVGVTALLTGCLRAPAGPTPFPAIPAPISPPTDLPALQAPAQPPPTPTPDPYAGLTIEDLIRQTYGEGRIEFESEQRVSSRFSRYLFHYPSDHLTVHGFLNLPTGQGPFPVVLVLHGYVDPAEYETLSYTTSYADALAAEGFLVLHPNYRNYPPSDSGPSLFRVGYAVDVLNLIALVHSQAGEPGPLQAADPTDIGLFGHSMGGGIALRVLTVGSPVEAAVLYGSMNADEHLNFEKIYEWSDGTRGLEELNVPLADLARISPSNYLDRIQVPVSIHHGGADELVPPEWSDELCLRLSTMGKTVECYTYPAEPHTFIGFGGIELIERAVAFFRASFSDP
ncbi:MAG: alpha/beta hydrolase family protein [Anaerolineales bacterium]